MGEGKGRGTRERDHVQGEQWRKKNNLWEFRLKGSYLGCDTDLEWGGVLRESMMVTLDEIPNSTGLGV